MPNKIVLKKSSVASKVPLVGDLDYGELAINYADGKLYYKKADGTTVDYFQAGSSNVSELHVGDVPPSNPVQKPLWWDSVGGSLYIYYTDVDGSQWVPATPVQNLSTLIKDSVIATDSTWSSSKIDTTKQNTLVSGTNIKTINGESVLGSGNIVVSGGSSITGTTDATTPFRTLVGTSAGASTTANYSTFFGYEAGYSNTTGANNTYVGPLTGRSNINGHSNVGLGYRANYSNSNGIRNVAVGFDALYSNVGGILNTAVGYQALFASTSASYNTAVGGSALTAVTTGTNNTGVGYWSLWGLTTGYGNSAVGYYALKGISTGYWNTAVGQEALQKGGVNFNTNTAVGYQALYNSETDNNVAVGSQAGRNVTAGNNTLIGTNAGYDGVTNLATGTNNTVLGYNATTSSTSVSNTVTLGNSSITTLRCQVTTITSLSDARDKTNVVDLNAGLDFINVLRPVAFEWNTRDGAKVGEHDTGFIAQELKSAQDKTGIVIPGLVYEDNPEKLEAGYGKLLPVMVKAIKELSAKIDSLQAELNKLKGI